MVVGEKQLRAIYDAPFDPAPRRAYAQALKKGDPRAELIALQPRQRFTELGVHTWPNEDEAKALATCPSLPDLTSGASSAFGACRDALGVAVRLVWPSPASW